jgi:PAS domain S-box-containing protein
MFNRLVKHGTLGFLCLVFLLVLICPLSAPAQVQPQVDLSQKTVLILHSLTSSASVFMDTSAGLVSKLESGGVPRVNQFYEALELGRNPGPEHRRLLVEQIRVRYGHRKLDMIITMYPEALRFVLDDAGDIFPHVPILALHLPGGYELPKADRRITGHIGNLDIIGTFEIAMKLVPRAKRVYVVSGAHELDRGFAKLARRDLKKWDGRLDFRDVSNIPFEDILATLSDAPSDTVVLLLIFSRDIAGRSYTAQTLSQRLSQVSKAPIFGLLENALGYGIVGGSLIDFEHIGVKAGQQALAILRGTPTAESFPQSLDVPCVAMFDWRQLKRWNLKEGALPKGSIVINRELTLWDFKYYIIGGIVLFLAQTLLVIGLLIQRHHKRRAEASLRQRTEELDQFFNVNLDLLCIANTDGYFLRLNPAAERVLGYTREELMAKRFLDFMHPDDVDKTREVVSTLASQQRVFFFENRYRCKDGTYRWLEWSSAPVGKLIYAAARDVTKRKLAERALEERLRFERLVSGISARFMKIPPDRVDSEIEYGLTQILEFFQVDRCGLARIFPDKATWQITHVVAAKDVPTVPRGIELSVSLRPWAYEKLVLKREVLSFSRIDDLPAEADVDRQGYIEWGIRSNLNIPIIAGESIDHIIVIHSVKRERVWPEEFIPRLRLVGEILVNAMERRQIRLQIEERLRFEGLISNLSASFVNLPLDEVESHVNKGIRSIAEFFDADQCSIGSSDDRAQLGFTFEYRLAETEPGLEFLSKEQRSWYMEQLIRGKPVVMNRVEDLPPEAEKEHQLCLAKGIKSLLAVPMLSKGKTVGSCILVSTRAERVWPEELVKRFRIISEVFANALERKRAEQEAFDTRRELMRMERVSRMGELTGSLAHELNQPLAAILSNAQAGLRFLQSGRVDLEEFREILHDIIQDDQRAGNVIRSLRAMMKREEADRNPVYLNSLLNDVVQIFHAESVFRNVRVETEFDGSIPPVLADRVQLQQVALNLILNAADAMSLNPPEHRQMILSTGVKNDRIRVTVRDFGPGIDQVNLERIFEPFFSTKKAGFGMGLSVCRTIVEAHEGRIWAENNPDRGATFIFEIPISGTSG